VTVSVHKSKPVPPGTLRRILDETDISVARLEELL
jgi:predicted RNA binding protein YcfA (HicA-like mRNA interferase family)